jgi:hypothetical protein
LHHLLGLREYLRTDALCPYPAQLQRSLAMEEKDGFR